MKNRKRRNREKKLHRTQKKEKKNRKRTWSHGKHKTKQQKTPPGKRRIKKTSEVDMENRKLRKHKIHQRKTELESTRRVPPMKNGHKRKMKKRDKNYHGLIFRIKLSLV